MNKTVDKYFYGLNQTCILLGLIGGVFTGTFFMFTFSGDLPLLFFLFACLFVNGMALEKIRGL